MANIKVELSYVIVDGQTLTFKAPCDCSNVTGIKVEYPNGEDVAFKVFSFADAHGNDLSGIGNLFVEGAIVKVILDTTANKAFVQNADTNAYIENTFLKKSGGTMSGAIAMGNKKITGLGTPTANTDAATKAYADTMLPKAGGTMSGAINMGSKKITNLATPTANTDAVTKAYADIGKLTLLWTNSKPTSSFAAQTVELTLSGYDYVGVASTWDINNPHRTLPFMVAQVGGSYDGGYMGGRNPSDGTFVGRSMDVTTSGVTFAAAYKGTSSNNQVCIPFAIFGINV